MTDAIRQVIDRAGSQTKLAQLIGVTPQAVQQWVAAGEIPPRRVLDVERVTGVSRHLIRPDIYGPASNAAA